MSRIYTHPDNLKLIPKAEPQQFCGLSFKPIGGIEITVDAIFPKSRKTGRLLWEKDPFVTYEDSDRQWGLALGFCKEEEEPLFYEIPEIPAFEVQMEAFADDMLRRTIESLWVPNSPPSGFLMRTWS